MCATERSQLHPTPRTVAYSVHAPDSVAPGAQYALDTDIGYAVPTDAVGGGIALWQASEGGLSLGGDVTAAAGAPSIHGIVTFPAPNLGGGVVEIGLVGFAVTGARSQPDVTERCTPDAPSVVARIGVGVPLVSIGDAAVVEGSSGTRALEFAVSLSRPAATPVTVAFDTEDGTATAGSDYVAQ